MPKNLCPCSTLWFGIIFTTNLVPPGQFMAPYASFMAIWGHFGPFWSPPMALPDGSKGSNTSIWMYPTQIQPRSRQYHQFGASIDDYIQLSQFQAFWAHLGAPRGPPGPQKWSQPPKNVGALLKYHN